MQRCFSWLLGASHRSAACMMCATVSTLTILASVKPHLVRVEGPAQRSAQGSGQGRRPELRAQVKVGVRRLGDQVKVGVRRLGAHDAAQQLEAREQVTVGEVRLGLRVRRTAA